MRPTQSELIERIDSLTRENPVTHDEMDFGAECYRKALRDIRSFLANPWIPVEERLPELHDPVCIRRGDRRRAGYMTAYNWWDTFEGVYCNDVTHWCPLPPLPTKGECRS